MCASLVWIENFEYLLNANICQLLDCDYMFNIIDYKKTRQIYFIKHNQD
jgi:hypothetical protein